MNDYLALHLSKPKRLTNTIAVQGQEYKGGLFMPIRLLNFSNAILKSS